MSAYRRRTRRRRKNPTASDVEGWLMLAAIGVGAYILYKGFESIKAAVCSISLPSWAGGSGESLFCETTDSQGNKVPSAFNTPATVFDASGNAVTAPAAGDTSQEVFATDPYTTNNF